MGRTLLPRDISPIPIQAVLPQFHQQFKYLLLTMPRIEAILMPYTKSMNIWHCPSDHGDPKIPFYFNSSGELQTLSFIPTIFQAAGTSYDYNLWPGLYDLPYPGYCYQGNKEVSVSHLPIVHDISIFSHKPSEDLTPRINELYADGHVKMAIGYGVFGDFIDCFGNNVNE